METTGTPLPGQQPDFPTLEDLLARVLELRPLSSVATRVIELTEDGRFSAHNLANVISTDQALTAQVLRLANSAYYGFPRRINTVRDAVVLLGFRAVRSATLATCLIDTNPGSNAIEPQQFWRFSIVVGLLAETLASVENTHQDQAFTAGVMHNIGVLVLDQHAPDVLRACIAHARANEITLHAAERSLLGYTDAELGGALALHWNLPPPLVDAVAHHRLNMDALPDPTSLSAMVIRARLYARAQGFTDGLDSRESTAVAPEWLRPPLSTHLLRLGDADGLATRADAFLRAAGVA